VKVLEFQMKCFAWFGRLAFLAHELAKAGFEVKTTNLSGSLVAEEQFAVELLRSSRLLPGTNGKSPS